MADRSHLNILQQGVDAWNNWRLQHPDIIPDLQEANLSGRDYSRVDFSNALLNKITADELVLYEANLTGAQLRNANCPSINLSKAKLERANLSGSILSEAYLVDARLSQVVARKTTMIKANLFGAFLNGADLSGADFREAILYQVDLRKANLISANFTRANLKEVNFAASMLNQAYLGHSDCERSVFKGASLVKTDLYRANCLQADLRETDMTEAVLYEANLEKANLEGAKLINANLQGANFQYSVLAATDLSGANISCSRIAGTAWRNVTLQNTMQQNLQVINRDNLDIRVDSVELALRTYIHLQDNQHNALAAATKKVVAIVHDQLDVENSLIPALKKLMTANGYYPLMITLNQTPAKSALESLTQLSNGCHFLITFLSELPFAQQVLNQVAPQISSALVLPIVESAHEAALKLESLVNYSWILPIKRVDNEDDLARVIDENMVRPYSNLGIKEDAGPAPATETEAAHQAETAKGDVPDEVEVLVREEVHPEADNDTVDEDVAEVKDDSVSTDSSNSGEGTTHTRNRRSRRRIDAGADERNESIVERKKSSRQDSADADKSTGGSTGELAESLLLEALEKNVSSGDSQDSLIISEGNEDTLEDDASQESEAGEAKDLTLSDVLTNDELTRQTSKVPNFGAKTGWLKYTVLAVAVIALTITTWILTHTDFQLRVPAGTQSYVYLDDELLLPDESKNGFEYYNLSNKLIGTYELKIYSTQLKDIKKQHFVRFKRHSQEITLSRDASVREIILEPDTLYSVIKLTEGIMPVISPDGQSVLFYRRNTNRFGRSSSDMTLFLYSMPDSSERQIRLSNRRFGKYEWDRPYFIDEQHVMFSAYDGRQTALYRINVGNGRINQVKFNPGNDWISFVPFSTDGRFLTGNTLYGTNGEKLQVINEATPFLDRVYQVAGGGATFYQEKSTGSGQRALKLQANYLSPDLQIRSLFEVFKGFNPPFISASKNADRIVISDYSGATAQFLTTIKLVTPDGMIQLSNPLADGARTYRNEQSHHRTEATIDGAGKKIVYEYDGQIYLIRLGAKATFPEFIDADMALKQ